jgi:hypothetical protein
MGEETLLEEDFRKILPLWFRIEPSWDEGCADIVTLLSLDEVEDQLWDFWSGDKDVLVW